MDELTAIDMQTYSNEPAARMWEAFGKGRKFLDKDASMVASLSCRAQQQGQEYTMLYRVTKKEYMKKFALGDLYFCPTLMPTSIIPGAVRQFGIDASISDPYYLLIEGGYRLEQGQM